MAGPKPDCVNTDARNVTAFVIGLAGCTVEQCCDVTVGQVSVVNVVLVDSELVFAVVVVVVVVLIVDDGKTDGVSSC